MTFLENDTFRIDRLGIAPGQEATRINAYRRDTDTAYLGDRD